MCVATFIALILFFIRNSVTESVLLIWSPGEAVCHGFTMGKNLDWQFECFKQNPFLFVLVSEGKTRLVKTFNYLWVLKINKTEITHPNINKSIILQVLWKVETKLMIIWYFLFVWQNTDFKLLAAVYNVRGDFLRWEELGGNNLQVSHSDWWYKWNFGRY